MQVELADGAVEEAQRVLAAVGATPEQVLDGRTSSRASSTAAARCRSCLLRSTAPAIAVASVSVSRPSLDDVYLHYTGRDFGSEDRGA